MGVIQSEPLGPGPGLARPQDSYLESHCPPPPTAILGSEEWTFRFQVQGGKQGRAHTQPGVLSTGARCWPCARDTDLGCGEGEEAAPGGGHAGPTAPSSRKRGRGGAFSRAQRGTHDYTRSSAGGFMRALAITTTICCAGHRQILFLFVSGSESRSSQEQPASA